MKHAVDITTMCTIDLLHLIVLALQLFNFDPCVIACRELQTREAFEPAVDIAFYYPWFQCIMYRSEEDDKKEGRAYT